MSTLLVVILVGAGETSHPATVGAANAARELLGADRNVEVREMEGGPTDERALSLGAALHASALVEIAWDTPEHRQVKIRVHLDKRPGWSDRHIVFDEGDDLAERGRTVGYAVASMMTAPAEEPARPPPAPAHPEGNVFPGAGIAPTESGARGRARGAIDAVASGAMGVPGSGGGFGGSLSGRWFFATPFAVRIAASARAGQVTPAQSTSLLLHAAGGVAWVPFAASRTTPFEFGARIDALVMREQLTHFDSDDADSGPVTAMRWLLGADAAVEAGWLFSPNAGFLGSFGAEVAFGRTDVTLHQEIVTTISPLRLVLQGGVRATF
jgi:hypothetical protein